jgi:hypothetical protein
MALVVEYLPIISKAHTKKKLKINKIKKEKKK